jgi:hypothetical protein
MEVPMVFPSALKKLPHIPTENSLKIESHCFCPLKGQKRGPKEVKKCLFVMKCAPRPLKSEKKTGK